MAKKEKRDSLAVFMAPTCRQVVRSPGIEIPASQ